MPTHRRRKARMIRVQERKLWRGWRPGQARLYGLAFKWRHLVHIDPRQGPKSYLDTLCHEILHICFPHASETAISKAGSLTARTLWQQKYRKVSQ